jgi:hypothetical protein
MNAQCYKCRFWDGGMSEKKQDEHGIPQTATGRCHVRAPRPQAEDALNTRNWPTTLSTDYCGDFKARREVTEK